MDSHFQQSAASLYLFPNLYRHVATPWWRDTPNPSIQSPGSRTGPVPKRGDRMMGSEPQDNYSYIDPLQGQKNATLTARALAGIEWEYVWLIRLREFESRRN